jgi:ribose 5-phosphate isomerase B
LSQLVEVNPKSKMRKGFEGYMKVVIACDHRGFEAKKKLLPYLRSKGHDVTDFGCESPAMCDYPDFAVPASRAVAKGEFDVAILLDGSGIGMSIVSNKVPGVFAALVHDQVTARQAREKMHCNVLCLGTDLMGEDQVRTIVDIFLNTPFEEGRHTQRIEKIKQIERER